MHNEDVEAYNRLCNACVNDNTQFVEQILSSNMLTKGR